MKKLETVLSKWNFQKIAVWYLILAFLAGTVCAGTVLFLYRERLELAWQYSRLEEAKDTDSLTDAAKKTAQASDDVTDVLISDRENRVIFSAKESAFSDGIADLTRADGEKQYYVSAQHPDAVFLLVRRKEFMLNSVFNRDFGEVRSEFEEDSLFDSELSSKTVYLLSAAKIGENGEKVYVISLPTSVPGGMTALKASAALAMLFFCIYWVLIALWLFRDASKHNLPPVGWGLIGLFTNIVGVLVYRIYLRSLSVCPTCHTAQNAENLYCIRCGKQLGARCERCGEKIRPKDAFCRRCGKEISDPSADRTV